MIDNSSCAFGVPNDELNVNDTAADATARSRKRQRNEAQWKQNVRKRLRNSGLAYVAANGKGVERRRMKNQVGGQCVHNCNDRLPTETREQIFLNYWSISDYHRQRDFICSHVLRKTVFGEKRRTANFEYFLTYSIVQTGVFGNSWYRRTNGQLHIESLCWKWHNLSGQARQTFPGNKKVS